MVERAMVFDLAALKRHGGEALEGGEIEYHGPLDHPVDQQLVALRVDGRDAGVVALEVQVRRRDDTAQVLQWCERDAPRGDTARPLEPGTLTEGADQAARDLRRVGSCGERC